MTDTDILIAKGLGIIALFTAIITTTIKIIFYKRLNIKTNFLLYWFGNYRFYKKEDKTSDVKNAEYINLFIISVFMLLSYWIFIYFFIIK